MSPETTQNESVESVKSFDSLPLSKAMRKALDQAGYTEPSAIQDGLIPGAIEGKDLLGQARTGTGKTAAYAIPIIERLHPPAKAPHPQALVLVPTRELAVQVRDEFEKLAKGRRVNCVAIYGGKPIRGQTAKLKKGAQIIVGTPGRVLDHMGRGSLDLSHLFCVVLDEADRMLDIGFRPDIEKILRRCPRDRQTLLLSATVPPPVERLAKRYMRTYERLDFSPKNLSVDTIDQYYFTVDQELKFPLLLRLLEREQPEQAIVFCRTKRGTERLFNKLKKKWKDVGCIHGDMQQNQRDRAMQAFRDGTVRILAATDVVGRGIDVTRISHIINYDIPQFCDDYIHRVGRTGRMGREGVAFTFVTPEQGSELTRIEMRIDQLLKRDEIEGFETQAATVETASTAEDGSDEAASGEGKPAPPPPLFGRRRKRYRRGL